MSDVGFRYQGQSPSPGQMTTLGIYMTVSLLMIVAALIEFAVVLIIQHSCEPSQHIQCRLSGNNEIASNKKEQTKIEDYASYCGESNNGKDGWMGSAKQPKPALPIHERIDRACFGIFPTIYVVFNAIYWAYYGMI